LKNELKNAKNFKETHENSEKKLLFDLKNSEEKFENLLEIYQTNLEKNNSKENFDKGTNTNFFDEENLSLQEQFEVLNEKIIDLEAELVISRSKIEKYKKKYPKNQKKPLESPFSPSETQDFYKKRKFSFQNF
jgi:hypothetical protein